MSNWSGRVHLAYAYDERGAIVGQPEHVNVGVRRDESEGLSECVLDRLAEREGVRAGRGDGEADVAVGRRQTSGHWGNFWMAFLQRVVTVCPQRQYLWTS